MAKKITFIWQKVDIYFQMGQSSTMVPKKRVDVDYAHFGVDLLQ